LRLRPRVLFICRQHGDEPVSTEAALQLVDRCAREGAQALDNEFGNVVVYIIPMANPDGASVLTRLTGVHADMNRDWGKFTQPETRAVYAAYKQIRPYAVVDMHSWTPGDSFLSDSIEVPADESGVLDEVSMDIDVQMRIIEDIKQSAGNTVTAFCYSSQSDMTLCHRFFGTKEHVVSMLVETASAPNTTAGMASRIAMDLCAIHVLTTSIATQPDAWEKIARQEGVSVAADNAMTQDYGGLTDGELLAQRAQARLLSRERHSITDSFWVYFAAIVVLIHFLGRPVWFAILRLLCRVDVAVIDSERGYVPPRRRYFPETSAPKRPSIPLKQSPSLRQSSAPRIAVH
jgi:hypothetical protein